MPDAPDVTPRAAVVGLPMVAGNITVRGGQHQRTATIRGRPAVPNAMDNIDANTTATAAAAAAASLNNTLGGGRPSPSAHQHRDIDSGPYRDEDVLLSLQLLAYLSKYPHVRQAFYKPRVTFHPASVNLPGARFGVGANSLGRDRGKEREKEKEREREKEKEKEREKEKEKSTSSSTSAATSTKEGLLRAFANAATGGSSRGKDRAQAPPPSSSSSTSTSTQTQATQTPVLTTTAATSGGAPSSARQTNVFSLVERFTFKPSSTETDLPNPPPRLPSEIQYWAGVIMRNACRKDDSRGGIRQCANSECFSDDCWALIFAARYRFPLLEMDFFPFILLFLFFAR